MTEVDTKIIHENSWLVNIGHKKHVLHLFGSKPMAPLPQVLVWAGYVTSIVVL